MCEVCESRNIEIDEGYGLCFDCGHSWKEESSGIWDLLKQYNH